MSGGGVVGDITGEIGDIGKAVGGATAGLASTVGGGFANALGGFVDAPLAIAGVVGNAVSGLIKGNNSSPTAGTPPPTIAPASAEYAAAQAQTIPKGRSANQLSTPQSELIASQNLGSAAKTLLGS